MYRKWEYTGDVNLKYGGVFIDIGNWEHGYCNAVRVTDLDSACGFRGAVLIEHATIFGCDSRDKITQSLESSGGLCVTRDRKSSPAEFKKWLRLIIAESLLSYGYCDPDTSWNTSSSSWSETVQCERDGPAQFDGWNATVFLDGDDLKEYIEENHL